MFRIGMALIASLALLPACACDEMGPGPSDPDAGPVIPPDTIAIELLPETVRLEIDGIVPVSQAFTVNAIDEAGGRTDVTGDATYQIDRSDLGRMSGPLFQSELIGGIATITAQLGTFTDTATLELVVTREVIVEGDPEIPVGPGDIFASAPDDPARAPAIVYPNDGVLLPSNFGTVEMHFRAAPNTELFEITLTSPGMSVTIYTRCQPLNGGCLYRPEPSIWTLLAATNRGGDPITVRMRGTDDLGTGVGTSESIEINVSAVPVTGGLYYWTTSNGTGIMRIDFGALDQQPERYFPFEGGGCFGCHAISRNGRKMTLSRNGQGDGRITIIDVATQQILVQDRDDFREQFQTWNPDSTQFAGVWADGDPVDTNIRIRDGDTGEVLETIAIGTEPDHPDWSPDGNRILFALVTRHQTSQRPGRAGISYVALDNGVWGPPQELIAPQDGKNRYYPAYAPDGQFFLFNESTCDPPTEIYNGGCDGDADPSAKLWAMAKDGGDAIPLDRVNTPGVEDQGETNLSNTFPRWAPFVDPRHRDGSGRIMWFTFSSRRQYGLRSPNGNDQLIWMAAVDPDAVEGGEDGSFVAFALPFQDLTTSNHIAQWTTTVVPTNPSDGGVDPTDGGMCIATGDPCDPDHDQCCPGTQCVENGPGIFLCRPNI